MQRVRSLQQYIVTDREGDPVEKSKKGWGVMIRGALRCYRREDQ